MGPWLELLLFWLLIAAMYQACNNHATLTILYVSYTAQYCTILHNTAQYCTILHNMHNTAQYAQVVLNASVSHQAAQARTLSELYSRTPLNGHPSIADTHDITDNSEKSRLSSYSLQCLSNPWIADTPLATPYNRQLSWSQLNTSKSNQLGTFGLVSRLFTLFYWPHIIDQSAEVQYETWVVTVLQEVMPVVWGILKLPRPLKRLSRALLSWLPLMACVLHVVLSVSRGYALYKGNLGNPSC